MSAGDELINAVPPFTIEHMFLISYFYGVRSVDEPFNLKRNRELFQIRRDYILVSGNILFNK